MTQTMNTSGGAPITPTVSQGGFWQEVAALSCELGRRRMERGPRISTRTGAVATRDAAPI